MLPTIGALRPWADPHVVSLGRLDMHPPTRVDGDGGSTSWRRSLGGRWDFRLFATPDDVPASTIAGSTPARSWTRVTVPGNWTLQGVGDHPQYTNVQMPFDGPPPCLPERNPTGVYRRTVTVPKRWSGRQVVVHIGGAESVHALFVNGSFVGYGTDSRLPSEYDVTAFVHPGSNDIAIVVVRWSAHSYVEDQDQWWMAGLHREVYVEARPSINLTELVCDANLHDTTGTLAVSATVGGLTPPNAGWTVRFSIETARGRRIARATSEVPHSFATPYRFAGHRATAQLEVADVDAWSAESPARYRVVAELLDPDGAVVEVHHQLIGFRRVEVRDRQLLVNGQPIWIFGVNRHDHHPTHGKAVTVDDMRSDLLAMRRHNITAVRCSHYPNDRRFLDLCDEIGMYVVDEANIESHAYNTSLCHDAGYRSTWLSRGARMVERDRNHPSVIMWSLGTESGYGANHDALAGWIRRTDPSRPLHYEGAVFHKGWVDGGVLASDVVCPMYPTIDAIEEYGRDGLGDRPLIMCEYSHAMGNSNGSLADYWDVITATPGLQGGFIWEWKDHGLLTRLPNGKRGFAYGGQFGDVPNDGNFVADGLMSTDLRPHPAMQEVTWVHRPVVASLDGELSVVNRRSFTDLSDLAATWELIVAGDIVEAGDLDVGAVAPGSTVRLALPCSIPDTPDAHLTIRWRQRRATPWSPRGHLVAWDQFPLTPTPTEKCAPEPAHRADSRTFRIERSTDPKCAENYPPSGLRSTFFGKGGEGVDGGGPELAVFRAPVDNDGLKLLADLGEGFNVGSKALARWRHAGVDRVAANDVVDHRHEVEVLADSSEIHTHEVHVDVDVARVGVAFELRPGFDRLRWYGRGPLENYPDRNRGALVGTWESGIDESPYLVPQEFGLRTDCRWFEFVSDDATVRLDVIDPTVMHVSATRFSAQDLYAAEHETDLRPRRTLVVHADVVHRGVGTASCGPDVLDRYVVGPGRYRFSYRLSVR